LGDASVCFSIYINDPSSVIENCKYHLHADDLHIYIKCAPSAITEAIWSLTTGITAINDWATANALKLNLDKTQIILLRSRMMIFCIDINKLAVVILNRVPISLWQKWKF